MRVFDNPINDAVNAVKLISLERDRHRFYGPLDRDLFYPFGREPNQMVFVTYIEVPGRSGEKHCLAVIGGPRCW